MITVDVSGAGGLPDGAITEADPPMLPRQAILPVVFAKESALARDSQRLAGSDWSAVFGTNDPVNGRIDGSRMAAGTITSNLIAQGGIQGSNLAAGTITSNQIQNGTIGAQQLALGAIGPNQIGDEAIINSKLATRSVTIEKMALRGVGPVVDRNGLALSPVANQEIAPSGDKDVTNLVVTINTFGRPIFVGLISDTNSVNSGDITISGESSFDQHSEVIFRNETEGRDISRSRIRLNSGAVSRVGLLLSYPASTFSTVCFPPPGTWVFRVRGDVVSGSLQFRNVRLIAYEL